MHNSTWGEGEGWSVNFKDFELSFKIYYYYYYLAALHGMWDLSSPTRDQTQAPCIGSAES